MKLTIKTNEYEITKLPFESVAEITIHDYDENKEINKLMNYIADLESELNDIKGGE